MTEKAERREVARPPRKAKPHGFPPFGALIRLQFEPPSALTDKVFEAIAAGNPDLRLERTANRELEVMSPAGGGSSKRHFRMYAQLGIWEMKEGQGLGECFDASGGFILPNGAIRSPDFAWVRKERLEGLTADEEEEFRRLCPDFVVELVSKSDRLTVARAKMREYLEQGARLGWLIDPIRKKVEIYRSGRPVERLDRPDSLSGEDVLPGFVLKLDPIFPR